MTGISCATISKMRNGQLYKSDLRSAKDVNALINRGYRPSLENLGRICVALGIPFIEALKDVYPEILVWDAVSQKDGSVESRIYDLNEQIEENGLPELF